MDRTREARGTTAMAFSNGLSRRRHRTSLRGSPEEDGSVELPETVRLRDRGGSGKKERDRERDRDRDRFRDRLSQSKRRRADALMHGSNREDDGDESSEESVNHDDEEDDGGDAGGGGNAVRVLPPMSTAAASSLSSSLLNHSSRRRFESASTESAAKLFKPVAPWKAADEMIGVLVPRKARSASTKRSHEWLSSSGHVPIGSAGEQVFRQASTSPVRSSVATMTASPMRPVSPSSSNVSARKKMKTNGSKPRLPKSSSKSSSSDQDEIEIEIAEVLYGMMRQPQVPSSKHEAAGPDSVRFKNREESRFSGDAKSQISSPISNSPSAAAPQTSSSLPQNSSSSVTPMSAIAPKRKMPRLMKYDHENQLTLAVQGSLISTTGKSEPGQAAKIEAGSPDLDSVRGSSAAENGGTPSDLAAKPTSESELVKLENTAVVPDLEPSEGRESGNREAGAAKEERQSSPEKESCGLRLDDDRADSKITTKANDIESQRDEKLQIDLMALPSRSPEMEDNTDFAAQDPKPSEVKPLIKDDEKAMKVGSGEQGKNASSGEVKASSRSHKQAFYKNIDLQLDLEKKTDNGTSVGTTNTKLNQAIHKQQQQQQQMPSEKTVQPSNSLTLPMSMPGWPGGLPPLGYMTPFQGVVSMDGSAMAPPAIQPRPKKCATHYYIAQNIRNHQCMRMNFFWPAAAGSASLYGAKAGNLNVVPPADLPGRCGTAVLEKAPNLGLIAGKENNTTSAGNSLDPSQRNQQIMLQQTVPPGAPSNILQGPAFIFPLSQQQAAAAAAAAAASIRPGPGTGKAHNPGAVSASTSALTSASATAAAAASAMSFSYPSIPGGETQYLAILQNNGFPFPVPAHVSAAPAYRGSHAPGMPFFSSSFYSSQMYHPSQLQQQAPAHSTQAAQSGHQNSFISSGSTSSQKHLQNQQLQRQPHSSVGNGSLQGFPSATKVQHSQQQNQHSSSHHSRSLDHEVSAEDSPLSADARVTNVSIYSPNVAVPVPAANFTLMSSVQMTGASSPSGISASEKKQQQEQQLGPRATGFDSLPSQAFAMSFSSLNSSTTAPGIDISSITPNHSVLQSLPKATTHSYQIFTAAPGTQSTQQKKNYRSSDEGKNGGNDAASEERRTKGSINMGQSIAFSRQDLTAEATVSLLPGSNVVDSSARTLTVGSTSARSSGSVMPAVVNTINSPPQRNQQQLQKQQQFAAAAVAAARNKTSSTGNGSVSMEQQLPSFSPATAPSAAAAGKSPNVLSPFQQNIVTSISSPNQSPQWKNSPRATPGVSQVPSSLNSTLSALKSYHQPQISFAAANSKGPNPSQVVGQQLPSSSQSHSPPIMVGSPTTSSMSRSTGGSPGMTTTTTTTASTGNKANQASILSTPQAKSSSPSVGGHKSPAVPGAVPAITGNSHIINSSGGGTKHQLSQQLPKQQHAQLFFTHSYVQVQSPHSTSSSAASVSSGYHPGKRNMDPKSLQQQPHQGSSVASPVSLVNSSTCDPVKAVAASSLKGGGLSSQGILHAAQFASVGQTPVGPHQIIPAGFSYIHTVQNAVPVKAASRNNLLMPERNPDDQTREGKNEKTKQR